MANLRDIKRRIMSVQSTQKITSAMKMVAAAKSNPTLSADYVEGKVLSAGYFYRHELSRVAELCRRLRQSEDTFAVAQAANF